MVVLNLVSTLALASLFSTFSQQVAGRPHNNHGGITRTVTEYSTRYVRSTQITTIVTPDVSPDVAVVQPAGPTGQPVAAGHSRSKSRTRKSRTTFTSKQQPQSHQNTKTKSATKSFTVTIESSSRTTSSSPVETNTKYPAASYSLVKSYCNGGSFFDEFNFFTGEDPTHGFVQYVDQGTASSAGLISEKNGVVYLAPDSTNIAPSGRQSVRLESKDTFNEVLIIADFSHVPQAVCGSWPAFWTANLNNWPAGGEIDILEGVNTDTVNHVALHATSNSLITPDQQTGSFDTLNCDVNAAGQANNAGCGGFSGLSTSYGEGFNNAGGGVYAMDWRSNGIRVWQFPRSNIPADIQSGNPTTANWGVPDFDFSGSGANIASHFNDHKIIFDMTFCGDWAGNVFGQSGCSGSCTDFVANNPTAFAQHFFAIQNLTVYQAN